MILRSTWWQFWSGPVPQGSHILIHSSVGAMIHPTTLGTLPSSCRQMARTPCTIQLRQSQQKSSLDGEWAVSQTHWHQFCRWSKIDQVDLISLPASLGCSPPLDLDMVKALQWVNTQWSVLTLHHWLSIDISWRTSVSCPLHGIAQAFLLVHFFSACPSFPHPMQTCLYQHLDACFPHFPWLNNWHRSLLHHVDTPCCPVDDPPCALWSPAALLKTCCTSRNLNFSNWSSDMLLTDPDQRWIALSRLRTWFCPPASADAK